MKSQAITGVISGAKNFLEKIIKLQTKENSFGQNQTLLKLKDYIIQIYHSVQGLKTTAQTNPISPTNTNSKDGGAGQAQSRNDNTQISLSTVNSAGTSEVSYHTGVRQGSDLKSVSGKGKSGKSGGRSKKKKVEGNPMLIMEQKIITMVAKT